MRLALGGIAAVLLWTGVAGCDSVSAEDLAPGTFEMHVRGDGKTADIFGDARTRIDSVYNPTTGGTTVRYVVVLDAGHTGGGELTFLSPVPPAEVQVGEGALSISLYDDEHPLRTNSGHLAFELDDSGRLKGEFDLEVLYGGSPFGGFSSREAQAVGAFYLDTAFE